MPTKRKQSPARHVMPLNTPQQVTSEMCRQYRLSVSGRITPETMHKYILALDRIRAARIAEAEGANPARGQYELNVRFVESNGNGGPIILDNDLLRIEKPS